MAPIDWNNWEMMGLMNQIGGGTTAAYVVPTERI